MVLFFFERLVPALLRRLMFSYKLILCASCACYFLRFFAFRRSMEKSLPSSLFLGLAIAAIFFCLLL